jgi:hypothetical protein
MRDHDVLGFVACGLVLTSFWMRDMLLLRLVAIASNVAFINYGHAAHILPVMVLHAILLPVNLWRVLSDSCVQKIDGRGNAKGMQMTAKLECGVPGQIQGQMLRLGEHHSVAIYLRDGVMWVADFVDGHGELVDANTWFRFNCGALANSHAQRRMALESATPISPELGERIEALHVAAAAGGGRGLIKVAKAFIAGLGRGRLMASAAGLIRRRKSREELSAR